jgi:hypothetical protein
MTASGDLDVRVDIAPDADPDGNPAEWSWLDVSAYRRQQADVAINQGRDDEAAEVEAGDASCTFNLRDGLLSPRNPYSELYGRIGINTPIRFRLPILVDTFSRTESAGSWGSADSGGTWSVGSSSWSVSTGAGRVSLAAAHTATTAYLTDVGSIDVDIVYSVSIGAVTTGAPWISALEMRRFDADNTYRVHTELKPSGVVTIKLVRREAGVNTDVIEDLTTSATYSANTKVWTRAVADGGFFRAKVWSGVLGDEPDAWNIESTLVVIQAGGIGLHQWRYVGNTNVGALAVAIDDLTADALLWSGNVPEWPPEWDKSGNDSTMSIEAAGPMRRLAQRSEDLESPLRRQLASYSPAGWWPGEDGTDATSLGSGISGGAPAEIYLVSPGQDDAPPGASGAFKIDATGSTVNGVITGDTTAEWAAMFFVKFASLPVSDTVVMEWRVKSGTARRYAIRANATGWQLKIYDVDGAFILDGGTVSYADAPTEWTAIQLEVDQNGGNVDWALNWNRIDTETFWSTSGSFAGTTARLSSFYIPGSTGMTDVLLSHIWAGSNDLPFVDWTFLAVSRGYDGELASDRIDRLCGEAGVPVSIHTGDSEPLGRQLPGELLDVLRNSAAADVGVLYERAGALAFLPRAARYNQAVTLALDWTGGDLAEAPKPIDDDQRLRNRWTISRTGGSKATYQNDESIARHGVVPDSAELNIASDDRLALFASWFTAVTTIDEMRWPVIELDLIAHPELRPAFLTCRIGSRVTVANPKSQVAGITIDLLIEGIKQTIGRNAWKVTLTCSPASPWFVGVWGDSTTDSRWGAATTTVQTDVAAGVTTIPITTVDPLERWSITASGYQWDLAGETVTVTAMGAATGPGPYLQDATVTRGVNGVDKLIPAGTRVKMKNPMRWGL